MNAVSPAVTHYLSSFESLADQLPGSDSGWLQRTRRTAIKRFVEVGFPSPRDEDWKYTRIAPIEKRNFSPGGALCVGLVEEDLERFFVPDLDCHRLVFINGRFQRQLSSPRLNAAGVEVLSMAEAMKQHTRHLEAHLDRYTGSARHGFTALNTAFMDDGAWIGIGKNVHLERPVHLLFLSTAQEEDTVAHPRILIVGERGSRSTVIESYAALGDGGYFNNALTEVALSDNASLEHYKLQDESTRAFHVATMQVRQGRDARFVSHSISTGGLLVRNDINVLLDAEGAECMLNGLYMGDGRQHVDYHTRIDHAHPNGTSKEFYKGILAGRARGVFNGRVYVHPHAQRTDAEQANNNLLLSPHAEIDTKPQLEIFADDVKCSHGATVGQLDENMLFYLRSRGIDAGAARALLTYGFAQDVIGRMALASVRDSLEQRLVSWLPDAEHIRDIVQ